MLGDRAVRNPFYAAEKDSDQGIGVDGEVESVCGRLTVLLSATTS